MTKRRLLLIATVPLTIALTLGVLAMLPPRPGVTKANFDRIRIGRTLVEVQEIFGTKGFIFTIDIPFPEGTTWRVWQADDGSNVQIGFVDDCVVGGEWNDSNETTLDKLRRLLHLQ